VEEEHCGDQLELVSVVCTSPVKNFVVNDRETITSQQLELAVNLSARGFYGDLYGKVSIEMCIVWSFDSLSFQHVSIGHHYSLCSLNDRVGNNF